MSPSATLPSTTLKTIASAFLGLFLAMGLLWTGPAAAQDNPTVSIQSQAADSGQAVDVPVTVTDFNSVGSLLLVVNYDPEVLSLADSVGLIEGAPREGFDANVAEPGELRISWFDGTGENPITLEDGTLLTLTFSEFAGGTSELTFGDDSELTDETATTIDATFENGVVSGELATVSVGSVSDAGLNQTVSVPLSGEGLQNVGSASIELGFDDAALQFEGIANDNSGLDLEADASDGVVSIGGFNTDGTTLDSSFVEVEFSFLGGTSNVTVLDNTEITDPSGTPIESAFQNGSISGDAPTLSFADRNVQPGDTVSVALQASEVPNLGAASVDVTFNAASLSFLGTSEPIVDDLEAGNPETGVVNVGFFSTNGVNPADNDGKLVDLRFAVSEQFSPGNTTTLGFADGGELTNPTGTAYNTTFEGGTITSIDRQVALGTQALDLTAGDTELQVTEVVAEAGDVVVITTDNGDGAFGDETVVGAREVSSELDGGNLLVDVLGDDATEDAAPGDHAAHISTDGTVGGVVATSETAAIYGVAQFNWEDETVIEDTSTVTVDVIEVLYGGEVGPDTLSIDLHDATGGTVGAFIGVSQEDLAVGEVHEDVAIDVLEPRGPGDDSERVEDVIDETGEFFAMAHLGPAGTDANGDRIPAQQPSLATTVDPGTVGDFATVGIGIAVDVTRDFGDASNQANYELVALPGDPGVDVAETVSGEQGPNWRVFRELGATNDGDAGLQEYDGSDAFNFQEGRAFWVISQNPLSFQGVVSPTTSSAIDLQGGWNAISNPLQSDLDWQSVQDANSLDEALWRWDGGWSQVDTLESAQTGEGYYVFNGAELDSLSLTEGTGGSALAAKNSEPRTVELTARADEEDGSSITVGIGSETSTYRAPPAHFASSKTTLRVLGSDSDDEYARMVKPVDGESTTFSLVLRGQENQTATIEASGLDASGPEGAVLIDESSDQTYDLREMSTASIPTGDDGTVRLSLQVGAADAIGQAAVPEKTQLEGNYPNPFSQQTTVELALSEQTDVKVQVYNVLGQQVATVADGQMEAGSHKLEWDGSSLSSGVYFVRMQAGDATDTHKITVVR